MELITVDRCPACMVVKNRFPGLKARKPKLQELKKFKKFPTLVLDDGSQIEGAYKIALYLDSPEQSWMR